LPFSTQSSIAVGQYREALNRVRAGFVEFRICPTLFASVAAFAMSSLDPSDESVATTDAAQPRLLEQSRHLLATGADAGGREIAVNPRGAVGPARLPVPLRPRPPDDA
jgi:hypothetical protein